ncbi:MAG TPA: VWA domain-containing protein [Gaiellaceae bacterium]
MRTAIRLGIAVLAASLAAGTAFGAGGSPSIVEAGGSTYPTRSYILSLPAARSLASTEVHVTENGVPATGITVARQGTQQSRSGIVLVLDESLTMKGQPLASALAAARAFAAHAGPNRLVAVVTFNGKVQVLQKFTSKTSSIDRALSETPALVYGTKNYDALQQALELIVSANVSSGSIIMLTDGQSVGNVSQPRAVLRALANAHVRVFPVGLSSPVFEAAPLQQIARATGGSFVEANGSSALKPILETLGRRLSSEYLLTYVSRSNPQTDVDVHVSVKGFSGFATSAYTTPALTVVNAKPYKRSPFDRIVQSVYLMAAMAVLFAALLGFAVVHVARPRSERLVDRVSDFVAVPGAKPTRAEPTERKPLFSRRLAMFKRTGSGEDDWYQRLVLALDIADLEVGPYQLMFITALVTLLLTFIFVSFNILGLAFVVITPLAVRAFVKSRMAKRRRTFAEQLPDNLDVLASSLRAGHSLVGALTVVAQDANEPSKGEFQRVLAEEQFGVQLEDALQIAVKRMSNQDLDQVALVARLQREMGSNSAEVLDHVVSTVRGRMELRRLIGTLTAQGRLSRWILTLLPVGLAFLMSTIAKGYMDPLFHKAAGKALLVLSAGMVCLGSWIIGKIVDIKLF